MRAMWNLISFCVGVFVGQEFVDLPRLRPYVEAGIRRAIAYSKDISAEVDKDAANKPKDVNRAKPRTWWFGSPRND